MATVLTSVQMSEELHKMFPAVKAWAFSDQSYAVVSRESVHALGRFLSRTLFGFRVMGWQTYFDCDDYARLAHVLACIMHRKARASNQGPDAEAPAFGQVWYRQARTGAHAVNWIRTEQGIELWEPQTQAWLDASPEELRSAWQLFA